MNNSKETTLCDFCKKRKAVIVYYNEVMDKSYNPKFEAKAICRICDNNAYKFLKGKHNFNW